MSTTKHLPANRLDQASIALLKNELRAALPGKEATAMAALPMTDLRPSLVAAIRSFGSLISADECEGCLQDLALVLPRAGLDDDAIHRSLDLYWGLLRKYGVTRDMLVMAGERYVMAPKKKGKDKFFPDPGELYELCAEEASGRKKAIGALLRALAILDGTAGTAPPTEGQEVPDIERKLRDLASTLTVKPRSRTMADDSAKKPAAPITARPCTDAAELVAALEKRSGIKLKPAA